MITVFGDKPLWHSAAKCWRVVVYVVYEYSDVVMGFRLRRMFFRICSAQKWFSLAVPLLARPNQSGGGTDLLHAAENNVFSLSVAATWDVCVTLAVSFLWRQHALQIRGLACAKRLSSSPSPTSTASHPPARALGAGITRQGRGEGRSLPDAKKHAPCQNLYPLELRPRFFWGKDGWN